MIIKEIKDRDDILINKLIDVWEASVRETHHFLSDEEILGIKNYVPQALKEIPVLVVGYDRNKPVAFMGIADKKLEMIFITPEKRKKGLGTKLVELGINHYKVNELCVNEQNPLAIKFYEKLGFEVYHRSDIDEQGAPFPILYMQRVIEQ